MISGETRHERLHSTDRSIVALADVDELARWWCLLNVYKWPDALPDPEPPIYAKGSRRGNLMRLIELKIGIRECLRMWNRPGVVRPYGMNDAEFDEWWANEGSFLRSVHCIQETGAA